MRDEWELFHLKRLQKSLTTLIPPKEAEPFVIYLFCESNPNFFGKIDSGPCDDFDYKVSAKFNTDLSVAFSITRDEYDLNRIDTNLFKRKAMSEYPFDKETFFNKTFKFKKALNNYTQDRI